MNRVIFQQVESLFEAAAGIDIRSRSDFLDRIEREQGREVRALLERLLERDRSQTRWLQTGAVVSAAPAPPSPIPPREPAAKAPGTVIGRFQLIERLGFGGHGEVYLAEQLEPVKRRVALKMVRLGAATGEVVSRFRAEQQALALMSHPSIATVHEAGLADEGVMYFAMEYVQGEPIDVYCDRRRLRVRQRLAVFLDVCIAVQHAHQKGLIHRDLKPSNILVAERDGKPVPVLIDFGIALATGTAEQLTAFQRETGGRAIGTPSYMSPEQAGATPDDVDTRTDIYALGVVLYELLTGRTPLDVIAPTGASMAQIRACIIEGGAPSPATLLARDAQTADLAARSRGGSIRRLQREIKGDLDAIVSHALAHDRAKRYQTVEALAHDIDCHLRHRPVSVGDGGAVGRGRKFVRRHRVIVGAVLAIMLALTIGVVMATLAMLRAEQAAEHSRAVNSFLQDFLTSSRPLEKGSTVTFAEVLGSGSAMAGDRFADFPQQEGEVRYLIGRTYYALGLLQEARGQLEKSVALLRPTSGLDSPCTLHAMSLLAMTLVDQHRVDQAEALAREILEASRDRPPHLEHWLAAQRILSSIRYDRGEYKAAEDELRELIPRIDAQLGPHHMEAYSARMALAQALRRRFEDERHLPSSESLLDQQQAVLVETVRLQRERFGAEDAYPLLAAQMKLVELLIGKREFADAQRLVETIGPRVKARFGTGHWMFGSSALALASIRSARGDFAGAAEAYEEALKAWQLVHEAGHPIVLGAKRDFLPYLDDAGRIDEGLQLAKELNTALSPEMGGGHGLLSLEIQAWIARFMSRKGMLAEADAIFASFEKHAAELRTDPAGAVIMLFRAGHLARQERFDEATAELDELCKRQGGIGVGVNQGHPEDIAQMYAEVYDAAGEAEQARKYRDMAAAIREGRAIDSDN